MKKMLTLAITVLAFAGISAFAADKSPVQVSLLPTLAIPNVQTVHGLDLGLIASNIEEVQGLQATWIFGGTDKKLVGVQLGFVNKGNNVIGLQYGFYNGANKVTGVQLGFINVTEKMTGVQVGLVNLIKKSKVLPVMLLVNAYF
ncbi:MAG TPA: hypothetical protein DEE98_08400 [Elusimicrobia bacterium]|nr:MAG: hypothetical protein A2278_09505 [Elusimicrobia bacterium RIFOXYA12_FULL_49_49]OGS08023.1 MAG: hypothetical protein A2204_04495 [Elusimicrobia bacterium RIFOXYA1_FULL_47_7]OGS09788.1 MAG: hypothetical protein A2386_07870 [Elusimicrobia bacterium RIFOXYB1_FULL_48_9]OGS14868.1 MAG: hypothetical protein A2251_04835 [Elusimicrobia bacterium RIFOXYA2_FULL_47_53]OGS26513.1 MAG: hypothetical protein A2339_01840 [Elusimicrobia bacterium RIFOXYB12_FULL_50_12]OGS29915.1 MAG: hypothetical protein